MTITSYRDLQAWQLGMKFAEEVYKLTSIFPREERYGISSQLRRAAVSIPSHVAEGKQQGTRRAYAHYVDMALGAEGEAQTQLELAHRLGLAPTDQIAAVIERASEVGRTLRGLQRSLRLPEREPEREREPRTPKPETRNPKPET